MKLIDGKFFENGVEVKPEFGNKSQIELIQKHERLNEQFKTGLEVFPEFTTVVNARLDFTCICGHEIYSHMEGLDEFEGDEVFNKQTESCHKCNRKYIFEFINGQLFVKAK